MSRQRSLRVTVAVAILAAVLMIFMPLANLFAGNTPGNGPEMSAMSDCGMCPKSDMVMVNCAQAMCDYRQWRLPAPLLSPLRRCAIVPSS